MTDPHADTTLPEAPAAATVDLVESETETQLRTAVREMLAQLSPPEQVLARCESADLDPDRRLWHTLAREMGLAGLAIPEAYEGGGAGWREVAVVLTELGRAVAPTPYLGSAVLATATLLAVPPGPERDELLRTLASGSAVAALTVPFATPPGRWAPTVVADDELLTGTVLGVADAGTATMLLVPTESGLYAVPATAAGVARESVTSLDLTRPLCDLHLAGAGGRRLADAAAGSAAVAAALTTGAALLAAEQVGVAQWCLDTTVDYVRTRHQFGRPVGSFQAVKHRLAEVWVAVSQARAVADYAAAVLAQAEPTGVGGDPATAGEAAVAAALAQSFCGPVAVAAAEECVQLHGGIGFTWEHPAHLFLKRAKCAAVVLGSAERPHSGLAVAVNLPAA